MGSVSLLRVAAAFLRDRPVTISEVKTQDAYQPDDERGCLVP